MILSEGLCLRVGNLKMTVNFEHGFESFFIGVLDTWLSLMDWRGSCDVSRTGQMI